MSCNSCQNTPITNIQKCVIDNAKRKRIWKQSQMSASHGLFRKKTLLVSKMVGESACPDKLGQAGGPGDLHRSGKKKNPFQKRHFRHSTGQGGAKPELAYWSKFSPPTIHFTTKPFQI